MGRSVCDEIRKELLKKLFQFSVSQHKMSKTGDFFEKIEGDVNVMVGFFSNMLIDIMSSSFMIVGILVVFLTKSLILGGIFCVIAVLIFVIFIGTQKSLSALWNDARVSETKLFGEFSEDVYAAADVKGIGKEDYIHERFHKDFAEFEQKQVKASFWGKFAGDGVFLPAKCCGRNCTADRSPAVKSWQIVNWRTVFADELCRLIEHAVFSFKISVCADADVACCSKKSEFHI